MITDVAGKVRNTPLPMSKPLLPLFEAISNSMQSIEDAKEENGRIDIEVLRDTMLTSKNTASSDRQLADIIGFAIKDNGIGFDDQNFKSFETSDTTSKASRGGKGIGRFMWLVAFDSVEIESYFQVDNGMKVRKFTFCTSDTGIEKTTCDDTTETERKTIVRLLRMKEKYKKPCPKKLSTIAAFIVEEFLDIFIGPSCPKITLYDNAADAPIDLDEFYEKEMVAHSEHKEIEIKKAKYDILHVRLYSTHIPEHCIYLCANDRAVLKEKLTSIPNLAKRLQDDQNKDFVYAVYVNSKVLDDAVTPDRTGFNMSEETNGLLPDDVTLNEIKKAVSEHCKEYLAPYTEPIAKQKKERIQQFTENDGAMYRPIMKHLEGSFDTISPSASDDEIDIHLYEAYHDLQVALKKEGKELLAAEAPKDSEFDDFKKKFEEYFEKVSEINRADLARYVCHRKAILEFLKKQLSVQSSGKYKLEDRIHSIIFPMGKTSDDVMFEDHNLWVIDERLAFHIFLSSDQAIRKAAPLDNNSGKELDIMVFDKAVAFSETTEVPFSSVTIIEFKRPQRNEYSERENPFSQIARYSEEIRQGKARLHDGRSMPVSPNLPFYCYVICDITPKLREWAQLFELQETPDGLGFFGYKRHYGAYVEVISYSKLVSQAEKRNQAFFEKLGLPKRIPVPTTPT